MRNWWLFVPCTLCVGFSQALPLYLFLNQRQFTLRGI
ncbi:hypothetical protein C0081_08455 [Cohaesibacter celericrescens]|uniref:Uncharacterized protein n=1 Tax=Cohaesibacter celericrescens TaxID=2067669 RepID=A0A2N5XS71_9HYPH|nr:hypothetical protein C0081_08455 [Cohaesibacter celericrescens]